MFKLVHRRASPVRFAAMQRAFHSYCGFYVSLHGSLSVRFGPGVGVGHQVRRRDADAWGMRLFRKVTEYAVVLIMGFLGLWLYSSIESYSNALQECRSDLQTAQSGLALLKPAPGENRGHGPWDDFRPPTKKEKKLTGQAFWDQFEAEKP